MNRESNLTGIEGSTFIGGTTKIEITQNVNSKNSLQKEQIAKSRKITLSVSVTIETLTEVDDKAIRLHLDEQEKFVLEEIAKILEVKSLSVTKKSRKH